MHASRLCRISPQHKKQEKMNIKYGRIQMIYCVCPKCKAKLKIDENDTMPGCRELEAVYCPVCDEEVTKVFTSGIPTVTVEEK
jgi:hypothetical protein